MSMNKLMILPLAAATALAAGCASTGGYGGGYDDGGYGYYDRSYYDQYGRYDWDRPDPRHDGYYADNYYRNDRRYRERRLSNNDRIYRGRSEEHTSELQSLMRISYAVFCLKKKMNTESHTYNIHITGYQSHYQ